MTGVAPAELPPSLAANPRLATWLEFVDDTVGGVTSLLPSGLPSLP